MHKKGQHEHRKNLDEVPVGFKNHKSAADQIYEVNDVNENLINENELKLANHELTHEEEIKYRLERWHNFNDKLDKLTRTNEIHLAREVKKFIDQEKTRLEELGANINDLI